MAIFPIWYNHKILAWFFSWLTHVFTCSIHSWTFLVIIISISTYELTIIATKITKIDQLGPKIWHFSHTAGVTSKFSPWDLSWLFHVFTPRVKSWTFLFIMISKSTHELTKFAIKTIKVGQLGPEIWLFSQARILQLHRIGKMPNFGPPVEQS